MIYIGQCVKSFSVVNNGAADNDWACLRNQTLVVFHCIFRCHLHSFSTRVARLMSSCATEENQSRDNVGLVPGTDGTELARQARGRRVCQKPDSLLGKKFSLLFVRLMTPLLCGEGHDISHARCSRNMKKCVPFLFRNLGSSRLVMN